MLGAFGGLSSVELTATVSESGGLGSYGLYGYDAERIARTAHELRAATSKPFALNLWLTTDGSEAVHPSVKEFEEYRDLLGPYFAAAGIEPPSEPPARYLPRFDEQIAAVLEARPAVVSFVYGVPPAPVIEDAHSRGIVVVGTASTPEEAVALEQGGVDAIVVSGAEAGGHRVSFMRPAEDSLIGAFALIPQARDAVSVPLIAAGGIADARGATAAFALGADAVQLGTALLATRQSAATPPHHAALRGADAAHTVLTRALSGRLARGIPNRITSELADAAIAPFPVQNWLTGRFRPRAAELGLPELMSLWAGQNAPLIRHDDARELLTELFTTLDGGSV